MLVDAGFSFREIRKRLRAIGQDPEKIDAVLISHEHSDHVAGLPQLAKRLKVPIYLTGHTNETLAWNGIEPTRQFFEAGQRLVLGDIEIDTFTVPHDAVDPIAFNFRSQGVKIALVTDLGYLPQSVKQHVQGSDVLVLESNHDIEMLRGSPYPFFVRQRVGSRNGHLSNEAVQEFLATEFDRKAALLVLAHLSESNNHPGLAQLFARQGLEASGARNTRIVTAEQHCPTEVFEF